MADGAPPSVNETPGDLSGAELLGHGRAALDWIAEYLEQPERHRVLSSVKPGDIRASLPSSPPREPEALDTILADFDSKIVPGITHWNHPAFFGYFATSSSVPGILGELLTAALDVKAMLWKTSPAATELEQVVLDWLRQMLGLPLNRLLVPKAPPPPPASADMAGDGGGGPERHAPAGVPWTMIVLACVFGATWFVSTAFAAHLPRLLEALGATQAAAVAAGALVGPAQVAARAAEYGFLRRVSPMVSARLATSLHPLGAVLLQFPMKTVVAALGRTLHAFAPPRKQHEQTIQMLVNFANKARRNGVVSLDSDLQSIEDPFLRQALTLAVDGTEPNDLRKIMQVSLDCLADSEDQMPAVFEATGGFSPTIGILGAVLGLIQVMQHLDNITEVGRGIAVAFVATIYGVGIANLFFLPLAGKMRIRLRDDVKRHEIMLDGVVSILEGMNPRMLEVKLNGFLNRDERERQERAA